MKRLYSGLGLVLIAVVTVAALVLGQYGLRHWRIDLTENHIHTLSPGTHHILAKLEKPVTVQFYYRKEQGNTLPKVRNYAAHVRDLLDEYRIVADGRLKVDEIDPEPYSEAEDKAAAAGLQAVPMGPGGDQLYFGLVVTGAGGSRQVIPFLHPDQAESLEYDISKAIYLASRAHEPTVGLISALKVGGGFDMAARSIAQPWASVEQLKQLYKVDDLGTDVKHIGKNIDLLLVIHPAGLPAQTRYAIDQFALSGRSVVVFVDPEAEAAGNSRLRVMMPGQPASSSSLPKLFAAWGVRMPVDKVVGDPSYALLVNPGEGQTPERDLALLGLDKAAINHDSVITRGLESINLSSAGALFPLKDAKTRFTPLLRSSKAAGLIDVGKVVNLADPSTLFKGFKPAGKRYVFLARVTGEADTAFPDGPPKPARQSKDDESDQGGSAKNEANGGKGAGAPPANKAGAPAKPAPQRTHGQVSLLIGTDTDVLTDRLWVSTQQFFGQRIEKPFADNGSLLVNAVDRLIGSPDLISIRSRGQFARPFTRVLDLQRAAEARLRQQADQLKQELIQTEHKLGALQKMKRGNKQVLDKAQQAELQRFLDRRLTIRKQLRHVKHQLTQDIEKLGTRLKLINILLIPLLLTLFVLLRRLWRSSRRRPSH